MMRDGTQIHLECQRYNGTFVLKRDFASAASSNKPLFVAEEDHLCFATNMGNLLDRLWRETRHNRVRCKLATSLVSNH